MHTFSEIHHYIIDIIHPDQPRKTRKIKVANDVEG